jgi:hypothetical protein
VQTNFVSPPQNVTVSAPATSQTVVIDRPVQTVSYQPVATSNVVLTGVNRIDTYNIIIRTDSTGENTIVAWDNNTQTSGEVVFGLTSQPNDTLNQYSYDFTTGVLADISAHHEVNLGKLELNRPYYIRIISRAGNSGSHVTSEITYIPVPGKSIVPEVSMPTATASIGSILAGLFSGRGLLLLLLIIVIIVALALITRRRNENNQ